MKKITVKFLISGMLILSLMLVAFSFSAFAQDADMLASGEWGDLSWTLDRSGNLTISGEGPMNDFDMSKIEAWEAHYASIKSLSIGNGITSIGKEAFEGCVYLVSVTIPENIEIIGEDAFKDCYKLVEVINKSSLELTAGDASHGKVAYYAFEVHDGESKLVNEDGYIFYTAGDDSYLLGYEGDDTELSLPADYNGEAYDIYKYAFWENRSITSVVIPEGVTCIGERAFGFCENLKTVTMPQSVTSIEDYAFASCPKLTSCAIPAGVTNIGVGAFVSCESLKNIVIPEGITSLESRTFEGCSALTSITIPSGVNYMGAGVFERCIGLEVVYINSSRVAASLTTAASGGRLLDNAKVILFDKAYTEANSFIEGLYPNVEKLHLENGDYTSYSKHSHDWKNSQCSVCEIKKSSETEVHTYVTTSTDDTHFDECFCGDKKNESKHSDANADGLCDTCAYSIKKSDNGKAKAGGCKSVLVGGSASAVLFVSAGALLIMKKKKRG